MELSELGKAPISEGAPAGEDAKYEPEYEELQDEMAKLTSPSASGGMDWKKVQELSTKILAEKSKDMMAGSYLTVALLKNQGFEGLAGGLSFMKDMVETHWENMFPPKKRMKGRKNAAEWMYGQVENFIKEGEHAPLARPTYDGIMGAFDSLDSFLSENMEDPPYSRTLQEALNMLPVQAAPEEQQQQAPQEEGGAQPAAQPAPAPATAAVTEEPGEIESPQDVQKILSNGFKHLRKVATYYLENDTSSHMIYRINRMSAWLGVENLPPQTDGATRIPPPADPVISALQNLYDSGDWENLLTAAESKINQFIFWLDLSRYSYEALSSLGGKYGAAKDAVARETTAFVDRLKGIENLAFSDGTPFADPFTKQWLQEMAGGEGGGPSAGAAAGGGDSLAAEVAETVAEANGLVKDKKVEEAVGMVHEKLASSPSRKERITWRIALSQLLINAKKMGTARPHLDLIIEDIENYGLAEFDPGLALQGYKVALTGLRTLKDEEAAKKADQVVGMIARIDPGEAIKFE